MLRREIEMPCKDFEYNLNVKEGMFSFKYVTLMSRR